MPLDQDRDFVSPWLVYDTCVCRGWVLCPSAQRFKLPIHV